MPRAETLAIVLTPLVAMATFALGLRVRASATVQAAIVYAAPPSAGRPGLAWQVLTLRDERGVREAIPVAGVSIVARSGGHESTWQGETNADGIGEGVARSPRNPRGRHRSDLTVRAKDDPVPLAEGRARWAKEPWGPTAQTNPYVQASEAGWRSRRRRRGLRAEARSRIRDERMGAACRDRAAGQPRSRVRPSRPSPSRASRWAAPSLRPAPTAGPSSSRNSRDARRGALDPRGARRAARQMVRLSAGRPGRELRGTSHRGYARQGDAAAHPRSHGPSPHLRRGGRRRGARSLVRRWKVDVAGGSALPHAAVTSLPPLAQGTYWVLTARRASRRRVARGRDDCPADPDARG